MPPPDERWKRFSILDAMKVVGAVAVLLVLVPAVLRFSVPDVLGFDFSTEPCKFLIVDELDRPISDAEVRLRQCPESRLGPDELVAMGVTNDTGRVGRKVADEVVAELEQEIVKAGQEVRGGHRNALS